MAGVPVVGRAHRAASAISFAHGENGLLYDAESSTALAAALSGLANDRAPAASALARAPPRQSSRSTKTPRSGSADTCRLRCVTDRTGAHRERRRSSRSSFPTRNGGPRCRRCLDAIRGQRDVPRPELVDRRFGSTDGTAECWLSRDGRRLRRDRAGRVQSRHDAQPRRRARARRIRRACWSRTRCPRGDDWLASLVAPLRARPVGGRRVRAAASRAPTPAPLTRRQLAGWVAGQAEARDVRIREPRRLRRAWTPMRAAAGLRLRQRLLLHSGDRSGQQHPFAADADRRRPRVGAARCCSPATRSRTCRTPSSCIRTIAAPGTS